MNDEAASSDDEATTGDTSSSEFLVPVAPERVLNGHRVAGGGTVPCSKCSRKVYAGETVLVHAHRGPAEGAWVITRLCCPVCQNRLIELALPQFDEGTELLARAVLMVSAGTELESYLALTHVSVLDQSHTESQVDPDADEDEGAEKDDPRT